MFQGRYIKWNPYPLCEGQRMSCEALHDDWEGFRIWFKSESGPMLIAGLPPVLVYASSEDAARL